MFEASVGVQQPRLIIGLGLPAIRFLGEAVPKLCRWRRVRSFRELDEAGAVVRDVDLPGCQQPAHTVGLIHPSIRHGNLRHRRGWSPGTDPEIELVKEALHE